MKRETKEHVVLLNKQQEPQALNLYSFLPSIIWSNHASL